jgi:uncharacterized protein YukE
MAGAWAPPWRGRALPAQGQLAGQLGEERPHAQLPQRAQAEHLAGEVRLNPTLLKKQDGRVRGLANTCDTILHEMMHAYIDHVLGGWQGRGQESSHSNDLWVSECNRIAPRLGLQLVAARNKVRRVPLEDAPATKSGKRPTRVERLTTGTLSAGSSQPASPAVSFDREAAGVLDGPHFHGPPGNAHADKHHMCGPRRM